MASRPGIALVALGAVLAACESGTATLSPSPSGSTALGPSAPASVSESSSGAPTSSPAATGWLALGTAAGPAAREDHTWTVDGDGAVAYLFGGRGPGAPRGFADLWAYDLDTDSWRELEDGPPARFGHNAAWVPGTGLVIFAGQAGTTFYNDLWAYDPGTEAWRQLPAGGDRPIPRYGSCAALGPDGRLWISHGFTSEGARFADTRAYDVGTDAWADESPAGDVPVARCLHGCWWTLDGRFVLYGGQTTGTTALGDLWVLTIGQRPGTSTWAESSVLPMAARNLYAATSWSGGGDTLVFGGQAADGSYLGDLWVVIGANLSAQQLSAGGGPAGRSGAELIEDAARDRILLFGGRDGSTHYADMWEFIMGPPQA